MWTLKILFLIGATSRIRNFHDTLAILADRGHTVRLTGRLRKGSFELPRTVQHERMTGRVNPTERCDEWRDVVDLLRGARDYVRYFDPRYADATRLVRRAYEIAPTEFVLFCERHPWVRRHWSLAARALALAEDLIPTDPGFEEFVREEQPDLILVTPLVTFESYQTDYVKAAHRLGIPVVFIPFSWDNLTNKGLMRIQPDRVLVWNDVQRREAIELHGCAPERVVVTGAARFDDFFGGRPSTSRDEFFAEHRLDPSRPLLLYLGSSQLTGPNEMELVRRWAESIRASDDPLVRDAALLVRPHPALRNSYASVDYSDLGQVALSLNASRNADQELFDSLYHAQAAIGLNTSAMLEAAIVGRPVHTLVIPGFDQGQIGTIHFHYLVEAYGGLATIARDFPEHHRQLAAVLRDEPQVSPRSRDFAQQFLRPHGVDTPVAPILAAEIERAMTIAKQPRASVPAWHPPLRRALLLWLGRRREAARAAVDTTVIATSMSLRPVRTALEEIQQGTGPVLVGPWNDSLGNEILYWIPFVRWAAATYGLPPERLIALSRGGALPWYSSVAGRALDIGALFSASELQHWQRRTVPQSEQDPKQAVMAPFDGEIVERAARTFELTEYQVLHPSMLFRVLSRLHKDRATTQLADLLQHVRLDGDGRRRIDRLPRSFVAVSVAFTEALPKDAENGSFLAALVADLSAERHVVIVDWPPPADVELPVSPRVSRLDALEATGDALDLQARAIAQAEAFVGSYGDLAILASFCGTPALTYHSERLPADCLDRLQAAAASAGWAPVTVERARRFRGVRMPIKVHA
ncbi:MAG: hypothetical protein HY657_06435 [Acidobacteria bacterium]|nr:hypothetical protein [Acidobacteriota bacterium]